MSNDVNERTELRHQEADASVSLPDAVGQALDEARMVLPGVQALFGFQLVAVFNQRFDTALGEAAQLAHLAAIVSVGVAIAMLMAPAAYHRQRQRQHVSRHFLDLASRLISWALLPLAVGLVVDVGLVAFVILRDVLWAAVVSAILAGVLGWFWVGLPARHNPRR